MGPHTNVRRGPFLIRVVRIFSVDAVHDSNGLASYLIKYYDDTDVTLTDFE